MDRHEAQTYPFTLDDVHLYPLPKRYGDAQLFMRRHPNEGREIVAMLVGVVIGVAFVAAWLARRV